MRSNLSVASYSDYEHLYSATQLPNETTAKNWPLMQQITAMLFLFLLCLVSVSDASAQESQALLDKHFIIGGQPIESDEYPWVVALARNEEDSLFQRQFCGATVIADTWVLTAAHCLYNSRGVVISNSEFRVAINTIDLQETNVEELLVTNIYLHPEYDHRANNPHSDLALIELATSSGITPVKLSTKATAELIGLQATVIGWGATDITDASDPTFPSVSRSVDVPIVSMEVCNAPISYNDAIYQNQLCAGYAAGGRDSCVGDSGGPLVVAFEGEFQQVGVVSFGYGCAEPNFYGIYTDIPYFIGWINQYVLVGEPEFEPETLLTRGVDNRTYEGTQSDTGATSLFGLLLIGAGLLLRRRS